MCPEQHRLSIVLNIHREGEYLRGALHTIDLAARHATAFGLQIELIAVFDRTDAATRNSFADQKIPSISTTEIEVDHGNLSLARNAGVQRASGECVMLADGDDLISHDFIHRTYCRWLELNKAAIIFPELLVGFGSSNFITLYRDLKNASLLNLLEKNLFVSRATASRSVFIEHPFVETYPLSKYFFEDWHFISECVASGYDLAVANKTILYYRQHNQSLMAEARRQSNTHIAPTRLYQPLTFSRVAKNAYERRLSIDLSGPSVDEMKELMSFLMSDLDAIREAEPALKPDAISACKIESYQIGPTTFGACYYEISQLVGDAKFDHVFILPFSTHGGADKYIREIIFSLYKLHPTSQILALLGEISHTGSTEDQFPPSVTVVNLGRDWAHLNLEQRARIAILLTLGSAANSYVHVRESPFGEIFLEKSRDLLEGCKIVLYPFFSIKENPRQLQRYMCTSNTNAAYLLISDSVCVARNGSSYLNIPTTKWKCLRAPHRGSMYNELKDGARDAPAQALWASRISRQKRPELLHLLGGLLNEQFDVKLDVYGAIEIEENEVLKIKANCRYRGPFENFQEIDPSNYFCFIYTSHFDGMPNVLLEAAAAGLPIVAPNVGSIAEFIEDGVTGFLLPSMSDDCEMARLYSNAVGNILRDPLAAKNMARNAALRLTEMFSPTCHEEKIFKWFPPALRLGEAPQSYLNYPDNIASCSTLGSLPAAQIERASEKLKFLEEQHKRLRKAMLLASERAARREKEGAPPQFFDSKLLFSDGFLPESITRDLARAWQTKLWRELIRLVSKAGKVRR